MSSNAAPDLHSQAFEHHRAGRLAEAEALYRQNLALQPEDTRTMHMLGLLKYNAQEYGEAENFLRAALSFRQNDPVLFFHLASVLHAQGKLTEAAEQYKEALGRKPDFADALNNLGLILHEQKKHEEAVACFERAVHYKPDNADFSANFGQVLKDLGRFDEAMQCYARVLSMRPDWKAHASIGLMLQQKGQFEEAVSHYKRGLAINPHSFEILNNLGAVHDELAKYDEALHYFKKALEVQPQRDDVLNNIAMMYKNLGRLEEAFDYCKQALAIAPSNPALYHNILLTMVYAPTVTPDELAEMTRKFGKEIADPLIRKREFKNKKDPERKLRIGYVSPDFCEHPVRYFIEPLVDLHDRKNFEVFAYYSFSREDEVTKRLKKKFDHWRDIRFMDDDAAADMIEKDKIDILIDPTGHTGNNRLLVFARKPAPVQVTWLGYPASTGMKAMDYRITDPYAEPPGLYDHLNTETLWHLPEIFCCYKGDEKSPDVTGHPPFEDNGYITFGCFNNFTKVTDAVLQSWAKIMEQVPDSRLLLEIRGIDDPKFAKDVTGRLKKQGLPPERVMLEPRIKANQYVLYNRIDMALDPFPCVGGTTSLDTLWMGVPFVTLAGDRFGARMGVTILTNAGLPELIAQNIDEYIDLSVALANDRKRLKELRKDLRAKVKRSPLMDHKRFCRHMEEAYRGMWRRYCARDS